MQAWLKRQWFLCVLIGVLGLGYLWHVPGVFVNEHFHIKYMVGILLFFSAYSLPTGDILKAFASVKSLLMIVVMGYALAPLLAFAAMHGMFPEGSRLGQGVLLAASAPSTLASAVIWTRLGRGNDAMALAGTILMNSIAFIAIPPVLWLLMGQAVSINMMAIAKTLLFSLLIPVILGQAARMLKPALSNRLKPYVSVLNRAIILLIVLAKVSSARAQAGKTDLTIRAILTVLVAVAAVHSVTLAIAWFSSRMIRIKRPDRIAVSLTGSQKTLPVGTLLAESCFPGVSLVALPIILYHATQLVIDSFLVDIWKRQDEVSNADASRRPEDGCSSGDAPRDTVSDLS
ncbi:MAG: bile acid:sodium symporter [Planctomycetes bacterium]|nr:bile acid:sodium symporter [Planctomycetota bacterium]